MSICVNKVALGGRVNLRSKSPCFFLNKSSLPPPTLMWYPGNHTWRSFESCPLSSSYISAVISSAQASASSCSATPSLSFSSYHLFLTAVISSAQALASSCSVTPSLPFSSYHLYLKSLYGALGGMLAATPSAGKCHSVVLNGFLCSSRAIAW
jgi:hypothetical protein